MSVSNTILNESIGRNTNSPSLVWVLWNFVIKPNSVPAPDRQKVELKTRDNGKVIHNRKPALWNVFYSLSDTIVDRRIYKLKDNWH